MSRVILSVKFGVCFDGYLPTTSSVAPMIEDGISFIITPLFWPELIDIILSLYPRADAIIV